MATAAVFRYGIRRYGIRKAECLIAPLPGLVTWIPAVLLLSSLSVASARAQEAPGPPDRRQPEAQKVASLDSTPKVAGKAKKSAAKKDVSQIGQRGVGGGMNSYSLEEERKLGHELAQNIEMQTKLMVDPVITEYANRLGQRIVRNSDAQVPFTIKAIESDEINAFALPGGYFYVDTGLIMAADSEAELAGLMAHEIANVAAAPRHPSRNANAALERLVDRLDVL